MDNVIAKSRERDAEQGKSEKVYVPYPGGDEKYHDGRDWRLYNPEKYRDPNWSLDKE